MWYRIKISLQKPTQIYWLWEVQISIVQGIFVSMHFFVYKLYLHFRCLSFEDCWNHFSMFMYWQYIWLKIKFRQISSIDCCFKPKFLQNNKLLWKCYNYNTENTKMWHFFEDVMTWWVCQNLLYVHLFMNVLRSTYITITQPFLIGHPVTLNFNARFNEEKNCLSLNGWSYIIVLPTIHRRSS